MEVTCKIVPVAYVGPQRVYVGSDQVNIPLPKSLRGSGDVIVQLTVDGQAANPVSLNFR